MICARDNLVAVLAVYVAVLGGVQWGFDSAGGVLCCR